MVIGIDLGTTNSLVGVWREQAVQLIPNAFGDYLTPSVVGVDIDGHTLIGLAAREQLSLRPERTVAAFKRLMGSAHVFNLGAQTFTAPELSALLLRQLKADAERFLGESVQRAVITVPAYFNDAQRKATRLAGELAGLKVERLLNEPTAAALAYGLHQQEESCFVVLDLGGGTFDVSVLELFDGVMEVRASSGDNLLGGEDFTDALMRVFIAAQPVLGDKSLITPNLLATIRQQAEQCKRALGSPEPAVMQVVYQDQPLSLQVTPEMFAQATDVLMQRLRAPIERALRDARLQLSEIKEIVLVGGATRMASVRQHVTRLFQRFPNVNVQPDEAIARGAAIQAGLIMQDAALDERVLIDVCPHTLGTEIAEEVNGVHSAGVFSPILERNTVIPASRSQTYVTISKNQTKIALPIYQGESRMVKNNTKLGEIEVKVPAAPAGEQSVEVRFTYDVSGLLEVDVLVCQTKERKQLVIHSGATQLSAAEIAARREVLANLKTPPEDMQQNKALLGRLERLYQELLAHEREHISELSRRFTAALQSQDPLLIERERKGIQAALEVFETSWL